MPGPDLARAYGQQIFANEVMLLPYYIAALNIEHAHYELSGTYQPFDGLCFVDTLDLAEANTSLQMFTEKNTERVDRQRQAPITVIIGNPPYNVGQVNENDNNKNRKYPNVDGRIRNTYAKASRATLNTKLYDPYVKFFRWATDRLQGRDGIVCLVTNNSFVDQVAFDGMRKHLAGDFSRIYHLDLGGNVRKNPKLSGTTHNVFQIQVGVGITIAVQRAADEGVRMQYASLPVDWTRGEKFDWLARHETLADVDWAVLAPDAADNWLSDEGAAEFSTFMPIGSKASKRASSSESGVDSIFKLYSLGVSTNRDDTAYDFQPAALVGKIKGFAQGYLTEKARYEGHGRPTDIDAFLDYSALKWSRNLKRSLRTGSPFVFDPSRVRESVYRPFSKRHVYLADIVIDELGQIPAFFPTAASELENFAIVVSAVAGERPFFAVAVNIIPNLNFVGFGGGGQCFPLFVYGADGATRRENITDWCLDRFRMHYADQSLGKRDIFEYTYGILHHRGYRESFGATLKRQLPRIPFAPDFEAFREAGRKLMELHTGYEAGREYPLAAVQDRSVPFSWAVSDRMRLNRDRTAVQINDSLALSGIPSEALEYRLGNRSALEWIIDQYRVSRDASTHAITSDPNRPDDPEYIVRLVRQIVATSIDTMAIVGRLPERYS